MSLLVLDEWLAPKHEIKIPRVLVPGTTNGEKAFHQQCVKVRQRYKPDGENLKS